MNTIQKNTKRSEPIILPTCGRCSGLFIMVALGLLCIDGRTAGAASYALTNSDVMNTSSFSAGVGITNWDSGQPPAPGNDYFVAGNRTLRTPSNGLASASYTFAGDSLFLAGSLLMKGSNIITIPSLTLSNGVVQNGDPGVTPKISRIAGAINVLTNGALRPTETNRILVVTASLSGSGGLSYSDRGQVLVSGAHSYNGPVTTTGAMVDMDGTFSMWPSALVVGKDSSIVNGTNFYGGATNIVRNGGSLNVGYGSGGDLRVGWRTSSNTTNNPTGVLDVSSQSQFNANVGNFIIGHSQVSSSGTTASALGLVYLATNNNIVATNFVMGDTTEGTHPSQQQLILGRGSNYFDLPVMVVGARKQRVALTLPAGGSLFLTNSAGVRTDLTVGANDSTTSANPTDVMDLSGGPVVASLGNLVLGRKSAGSSGAVQATLTLATNSANALDVNDVTLGTMAGEASGATATARGTLNFNGGTMRINNNLLLGDLDVAGYGNSAGILNLNGGTVAIAGDILDGLGSGTLNISGGVLDLQPAGDPVAGAITVDTLVVNGIVTNAGAIQVNTSLTGSGSIVNQAGATTVSGTLSPGSGTTPGTLKLGSLILAPSATLLMHLTNNTTVGSGVNDLLEINGDVDLGGASLGIAQLTSGLASGTYRLANYTGELINTLTLPAVGRYTLSLLTETTTSPKHLNLVVGGNPYSLLWGGELSSVWDIDTTRNWTNQLHAQDFFFDNDTVLFADNSLNPNVTLDVTVQPGNVVFSNSAYALSGSGKITGTTGLSKQGTGSLYLGTSNDFTGPVNITGGLLMAGMTGALGATNSGTTIANGATLDVNDKSFQGELIHVQGAGYDGLGAIINSDTLNAQGDRTALRNVVLDGPTTFGGASRWDIRGSGAQGSGTLLGTNYTVTKVGPNGVYLTDGTVAAIGDVLINEGSFVIESGSVINPDSQINVGSGAALAFYRLANPMGRPVVVQDGGTIRSTDGSLVTQNQVSGTVTLNGVGYFNTTGNSTNHLQFSGQVTGPGQVIKTGGMTVELLSSSNNWLGGTTISSGTLAVGNGTVNGSLPATPNVITNNATLMFNVASNTTVTPLQEISGTGGLTKRGDGILALTVSNSFTGAVNTGTGDPLSGGIIRFLNDAAFGDPSVSKTASVIRAEVRLEGVAAIPPSIYLQTSAQSNITGVGYGLVALRNTGGNNTIANTVELIGGAGSSEFSCDAGLMTFAGPIYLGNTSSRSAIFSGLANGIVNGQLSDQVTTALTVEKRGPGTWTLTAANVYSGATIVSGGTLIIQGSIGGSGVTVSGGVLAGTGTINAPVTVQSQGTLGPGLSPGTLTINNSLTLQGTAVMEVGRNGAALVHDQAAVSGICTYGGTLIVNNIGSSPLQPGDSFPLFVASARNGTFSNIVYPGGYVWTNSLSGDGRVGVQSIGAATPPSFPPGAVMFLPDRNISLTATGAVGTPYRLWASTNVAASPITTTWTLINSGTISVSPLTISDLTATNYTKRFYLFSTP